MIATRLGFRLACGGSGVGGFGDPPTQYPFIKLCSSGETPCFII